MWLPSGDHTAAPRTRSGCEPSARAAGEVDNDKVALDVTWGLIERQPLAWRQAID